MVPTVARTLRAGHLVGRLALALAFLCRATPPLHAQASPAAQGATITGEVIEAKTARPLMGAVVKVDGTTIQATTDFRGRFTLTGLKPAEEVHLTIAHVGFQPLGVQARPGGPTLRLELVEQAVRLEELVVTGQAEGATARSLGNVVGKVDVSATVVVAPPVKVQDMLSVNVPGVRVLRAAGSVGSGGITRIRGVGSLSLSNEPLLYIDGIRVYNEAKVSTAAFQSFSGESPSRINDLNPEEIESIEIIKGPSASTIYGTEASNGVIQIITKKGRNSRPVWEVHGGWGANWLSNPEGRYSPTYYYANDAARTVTPFNTVAFQKTAGYPEIFSTGQPHNFGGSVSGGTNNISYYFGADYARNEGMLTYDHQDKYNARANIGYKSTDGKFKVDASMGFVHSNTHTAQAFQPITTSIIWSCNFSACAPDPADPENTGFNGPGHGFEFYRPEDYKETEGLDNLDRATLAVTLSHQPTSWFRHHLTVGPDFTNNNSSNLVWRHFDERRPFFAASDGSKLGQQSRALYLSADYGASGDWHPTSSLVSTTSAGVQYYHKQLTNLYGQGLIFAIPGPTDITGAAQRLASESYLENKTFGIYVQEQLAYKNRIFFTAAVRADGNSAFGKEFKKVFYPKFSGSWVLSEEKFLANKDWLPQLRVRAAWGRAGLQPDVFSALQTYRSAVGNGGVGMVTPQNLGNQDLKPEIGEEIEMGFDAGLFKQRAALEFTYYNKTTKDAILNIPLKPSGGYPGSQYVNIGETNNKGFEIALDVSALQKRNTGLDFRFTFAKNTGKIVDMGGLPPAIVGFAQQWNVQGFAPGSWFLKNVVSSDVVKPGPGITPYGTNIKCEGGTDLGNGDGSVVPCEDAPRIYAGQPTPTNTGSASVTLTLYRRLRLLALVDMQAGNHADVGDIGFSSMFFLNTRAVLTGDDPILSGYYGLSRQGYGGAGDAAGFFDAGFAKLRTVSASYEVPERMAKWVGASRASVTLSGENLGFVWRAQRAAYGVNWIDPEIRPNVLYDGAPSLNGYVQESFPQTMRVMFSVRLTY